MIDRSNNRVVATIEARMTSSRLPGKVLLPSLDEPMLMHLVRRLRAVPSIDEIVIATTINDTDQPIVDFAKSETIKCFRGSENDVLGRVVGAGLSEKADILVEITGDCPVIDPDLIEQTILMFMHHDVDYASNSLVRKYPDGMDTQVMWFKVLQEAEASTNDPLDREHVSRYIYQRPETYSLINLVAPPSLSWPGLGLTLDEPRDYELLGKVIETLGKNNPLFGCKEIIDFLRGNPGLVAINEDVIRKGDA